MKSVRRSGNRGESPGGQIEAACCLTRVWQVADGRGVRHHEPVAEVVPERPRHRALAQHRRPAR